MQRAPSLSTIEAFLAAAELGSFRAAANRLCLSAPAVTRRIQALERHAGAALFERRAGGVALTEAGRELAARMGPALDQLRAALGSSDEALRPVRLRASRSFAGLWLAPRFERLPEGMTLDLRSDLTLEGVVGGGADLGIFFDPAPTPQASAEMLLSVEIAVVGAPRFVGGRTPEDARATSVPLIELAGQPRFWPDRIPGARAALTFDGLQAMYEAAASGLGLAPGAHPLVEPYLASGRLVEWPEFGRRPFGAYRLVATRQSLRAKNVAALRDWLMREAAAA